MLLCLLLVLILRAPIPKWRRVRLSIFGLAAVWIAAEILRLAQGLPYTDVLLNKIVWGSIEVAIAAALTTLPIIYVLLRSECRERPVKPGEKINRDPPRSPSAVNITEPMDQEQGPTDHPYVWDGSTSPEPAALGDSCGLAPHSSLRNTVISSVVAGNLAGLTKQRPLRRASVRSPRFGSRTSPRMRGDDNNDAIAEWVELEEVDTPSAVGDMSSPEPDDGEGRSGIFVAREISREVHQTWEADRRPRIITIPQPARLHHNPM